MPDLSSAIDLILEFMGQVFSLLFSHLAFSLYGFSVSFGGMFVAFLIVVIIISVFWRSRVQ